jgi:hypothetical protein
MCTYGGFVDWLDKPPAVPAASLTFAITDFGQQAADINKKNTTNSCIISSERNVNLFCLIFFMKTTTQLASVSTAVTKRESIFM